ncbi:MAG: hypothetical protein GXY86_03695 [Firmicutes bacterium]|nr:hypothetical protein [Bacillota bacterium]
MNQKTMELLEFPKIKEMLAECALSKLGRKMAEDLTPRIKITAVGEILRETTEAKLLLEAAGTPPLHGLADLTEVLGRLKAGGVLDPLSLQAIGDFLRGCRRTRDFMQKRLELAPMVAGYSYGITSLEELEAEIERCIIDGTIGDDASPGLRKIRRDIKKLQDRIKSKLQQLLLSAEAKTWLQETVISVKDSRQVLMVKAAYKQHVPGVVLGSSGSGGTLFVEPLAVHRLSNELKVLEGSEQEEVYRILATLSGLLSEKTIQLESNLEIMAQYDLAFAKARFSRMLKGTAPTLNEKGRIKLVGAKHPLLTEQAVPLDLYIGTDYRTLVITGPNTGGKTVALKTIGLLTIMAQAGLHIPVETESEISIFREVLADIGDGQNIAQSLSTFSAHITNIIAILKDSDKQTLTLLDEVGTGTDPAEGAALAIAILEFLHEKGGVTAASTHYPEIKNYALHTPGFRNGCMAFDRENLQPLYRLIIGQPGESNALWIAAKLGMAQAVLEKAERQLTGSNLEKAPIISERIIADPEQATAVTLIEAIKPDQEEPPEILTESKQQPKKTKPNLKIGDLVRIPFLNEQGVVCSAPDSKGKIRVLVKDKKMELSAKRVQLHIPAKQLYPEDYDLNVVLLSKEERRQKHQMERKHIPGFSRVISEDEQ